MDTTDFEYVILPLIGFKYVLASDFKDGDDFFTLVSPLEDVEDDGIKRFVYIKITYENGKIWFAYYSNYYNIVYIDIEEMEAINEYIRRFENYIKGERKMKKFLIYVNDEREALKIAKNFRFEFTRGYEINFSCTNNKQGYIVLLIDNSNFIYIVYDRNVILNSIVNEKDFDNRCIYSTVHNTALLNNYCSFEETDSILKCIKRDLKEYNFKGSIDLQSLIKDVKFNPPATIVFWNDGTKTVVKSSEFDDYDPEKGFMLCVMKYLLKPQLTEDKKLRSYYKTITDYTDKFDEDEYDAERWADEFIKSFFNFTLDDESCESLEEQTSIGKDILYSIIDNIRNDPFNFVRFHGKRPNDIKFEEVSSVRTRHIQFGNSIKYISVIQCCNLETLEKILSNIYHLTTAEIILYYTKNYDEFIILSNNTVIIFLKDEMDAAFFYNVLVDNAQKRFLPLEDARYFIEYPYFQKYICDILTRIVDIKGEQ